MTDITPEAVAELKAQLDRQELLLNQDTILALIEHWEREQWQRIPDAFPKIGQRVLLCINGVVQHDSYQLDMADNGDAPYYHFWGRDDVDECPYVKEGDLWKPWPTTIPGESHD